MKPSRYLLLLLLLLAVDATAKQRPVVRFPLAGQVLMGFVPGTPIGFAATPEGIVASQLNTSTRRTTFRNTVELVLRNHSLLTEDASITVQADLTYLSIGAPTEVTVPITLQIDWKAAGSAKSTITSIYPFRDAYKARLKITDVAVSGASGANIPQLRVKLASHVELVVTFQEERVTSIDYNTVPGALAACADQTTDELVVSWAPHDDAEEYELEYTFTDDYTDDYGTARSPATIPYNFRDNSTRIQLKETYYRIPLLYERGYILYRIRAIGRGGPNFEQPVYCRWTGGSESGVVSGFPSRYYHSTGHGGDTMNWQVASTFAEEGKRSDVVKYYDGTFRERQTVTGINLERREPKPMEVPHPTLAACAAGRDKEREVIAAETIYDLQGRPAVSIMPAPTNSRRIQFQPQLNISAETQNPYSWIDFDSPKIACEPPEKLSDALTSGPMGAATYYSPNNPKQIGSNAFLPRSEGYPFSVVSYLQDNTGRVAVQSGVGPTFQFGQGHETRFYYGAPEQPELDRMFGTDVGDAIRYKKNAVMDANGQMSVTYINPEGKIIATALEGATPRQLDPLSDQWVHPDTVPLASKNVRNEDDRTIITEHTFTVTSDQTAYTFEYEIDPPSLVAETCIANAPPLCLDCIYDIEIRLTHVESCTSDRIFEYTGTIGELRKTSDGPTDVACDNSSSIGSYPRSNPQTLGVGTYTLTKKVTVNKAAALAYVEEAFKVTCQLKWEQLLTEELKKIDTLDCYSNCDSCDQSEEKVGDCKPQYCPPEPNRCDAIRLQMLADVSPGGQYAEFKRSDDGSIHAGSYKLSIFNPDNLLPAGGVTPAIRQSLGVPNNRELIDNWESEDAEKLLHLHPEYRMLGWCSEPGIKATLDFDQKILAAKTFAAALEKEFTTIATGPIESDDPGERPYMTLLNADPWFELPANAEIRTALRKKLERYGCGNPGFPIDRLAMEMAYCANATPTPETSEGMSVAIDPSMQTCALPFGYFSNHKFGSDHAVGTQGYLDDLEWTFLRALYLSAKSSVIDSMMNLYSETIGCNTRCIGNDDYYYWSGWSDGWSVGSPDGWFISHAYPPCQRPWNEWQNGRNPWIYYADKQNRFLPGLGGLMSTVNGRDENPIASGVHIDMRGVRASDDPCLYARTILDQAGSINGQVAALCDSTATTQRCTIDASLTELINAMLPQLDSGRTVAFTTAQLPPDLVAAGVTGATGTLGSDAVRILLLPCQSPIMIPRSQGSAPVSVCCITGLTCPGGIQCTFEITVNYRNGTSSQVRVNTKCTLIACDSTSSVCREATPELGAIQEMFNAIFEYRARNSRLPSRAEMLEMLPEELRQQGGRTASSVDIQFGSVVTASITYGDTSKGKVCRAVLQATTPVDWASVRLIFNLKPDLSQATGGITRAFTATVMLGTSPKKITTVAVQGSTNCWPTNRCRPRLPVLCGTIPKRPHPPIPEVNNCVKAFLETANSNASLRYHQWIDSMKNDLLERYYAHCMGAREKLRMIHESRQYHFTLYYYDQAGNLVRTVPPAGVKLLQTQAELDEVARSRAAGYDVRVVPNHAKASIYRFNTLNQVVAQRTPDAGESMFLYDGLGRIVASQNAQQKLDGNIFAYAKYDRLGRIVEGGRVQSAGINASLARDFTNWSGFINGQSSRSEIMFTQYDKPYTTAVSEKFGPAGQQNLRNRVASVFRFETKEDLDSRMYRHATHYSYDILGNVHTLVQDYPNDIIGDKKIVYDYDLQSGKVNSLSYQPDSADQFLHRYRYDALNRIIRVQTSENGLVWETDAEYFYYRHGPLARVELGTDKVQGLDYMYTLQGWIKGVNGVTDSPESDMGRDGTIQPANGTAVQVASINGSSQLLFGQDQLFGSTFNGPGYGVLHNPVARDAYGYVLDYYPGDYQSLAGNDNLADLQQQAGTVRPLYNGNISRMYTQIPLLDENGKWSLRNNGFNYGYDQLNRLVSHAAWQLDQTGTMAMLPGDAYRGRLTFDADGNILTNLRNGAVNNAGMDNLTYHYYLSNNTSTYDPASGVPDDATNRLAYVDDDPALSSGYEEDIDDQSAGNFTYDAIGNLIKDDAEGIEKIEWNLAGKIRRVQKRVAGSLKTIEFEYDALGNRLAKKVGNDSTVFYVRDGSGNVIGTYVHKGSELRLESNTIHGSGRVGEYRADRVLTSESQGTVEERTRGQRFYELANHLGNVLSVVTDRKIPNATTGASVVDSYSPTVMSSTDYYAFGMQMPGRTSSAVNYRFGFNGKENDDEIKGSGNSVAFEARIYDSRLGSFLSIDPLSARYPHFSPHQYSSNSPVWRVDIKGMEFKEIHEPGRTTISGVAKVDGEGGGKEEVKSLGGLNGQTIGDFTWTRVELSPSGEPAYTVPGVDQSSRPAPNRDNLPPELRDAGKAGEGGAWGAARFFQSSSQFTGRRAHDFAVARSLSEFEAADLGGGWGIGEAIWPYGPHEGVLVMVRRTRSKVDPSHPNAPFGKPLFVQYGNRRDIEELLRRYLAIRNLTVGRDKDAEEITEIYPEYYWGTRVVSPAP